MIAQLPLDFERKLREEYEAKALELKANAKEKLHLLSKESEDTLKSTLRFFRLQELGAALSKKERQIEKAKAEKEVAVEQKRKELVNKVLERVEQKLLLEKSDETMRKMIELLPNGAKVQVWKGSKIKGTTPSLSEFVARSSEGVAEYEVTLKTLIEQKQDELIKMILERLND